MSIAAKTQEALRSFRSLITFAMPRVFFIKDLKALENGTGTFFYRHVGPTDLKRSRLTMASAGDRPPRYGNVETGRALLPAEIETRRALLPASHRDMKHPRCPSVCALLSLIFLILLSVIFREP